MPNGRPSVRTINFDWEAHLYTVFSEVVDSVWDDGCLEHAGWPAAGVYP